QPDDGEWGVLKPGQYLIHDGDKKFGAAFKQMLDDADVKRVPLSPRSPWLNSFAERWVQSVKTEALSRMILFGERSLRHVLSEYLAHYHTERPHQGKSNVILFPSAQAEADRDSPIECRERLGGLLKYYHRQAA
ncbi:MAG: transposase, partial [Candidatus Tectomicrobia bacterium]|nr:transposase [Candidatus Tectomicrobia bacterium]